MKIKIKFTIYIENDDLLVKEEDIITANSISDAIFELKRKHNKNGARVNSISDIIKL